MTQDVKAPTQALGLEEINKQFHEKLASYGVEDTKAAVHGLMSATTGTTAAPASVTQTFCSVSKSVVSFLDGLAQIPFIGSKFAPAAAWVDTVYRNYVAPACKALGG